MGGGGGGREPEPYIKIAWINVGNSSHYFHCGDYFTLSFSDPNKMALPHHPDFKLCWPQWCLHFSFSDIGICTTCLENVFK